MSAEISRELRHYEKQTHEYNVCKRLSQAYVAQQLLQAYTGSQASLVAFASSFCNSLAAHLASLAAFRKQLLQACEYHFRKQLSQAYVVRHMSKAFVHELLAILVAASVADWGRLRFYKCVCAVGGRYLSVVSFHICC